MLSGVALPVAGALAGCTEGVEVLRRGESANSTPETGRWPGAGELTLEVVADGDEHVLVQPTTSERLWLSGATLEFDGRIRYTLGRKMDLVFHSASELRVYLDDRPPSRLDLASPRYRVGASLEDTLEFGEESDVALYNQRGERVAGTPGAPAKGTGAERR
ncbi:hypothetical protein [Natronobiforma cellulositropha]|uniref:hypothetical protein n=1 Tax=Natronobiforma cellulositropha TaxID=1679076 RepID=UPI0021D5993E|nr:hypothetical protein [Natronobiforma cellulositropha]